MWSLVKHSVVWLQHIIPPDDDHRPQVPLDVAVVGGAEHRDHLVIVTSEVMTLSVMGH